jgi:hypothetical protein
MNIDTQAVSLHLERQFLPAESHIHDIKLSPNNVRAADEMCQYGNLESGACATMKDSLISFMIASICTSDITHACVVFSDALAMTTKTTTTSTSLGCVPLDLNNKDGDIPMLSVTLKKHGVHWLRVVPMYRNQDCMKYQHEHVANMPQLRVVSVSCNCPFLSTFLSPARGAWEPLGSHKTSQYGANVVTKKRIDDDMTCKNEEMNSLRLDAGFLTILEKLAGGHREGLGLALLPGMYLTKRGSLHGDTECAIMQLLDLLGVQLVVGPRRHFVHLLSGISGKEHVGGDTWQK